ncbi:MAG: AmpG family muropeptide MFS transporter [bacterium]|nr:AmpG family muropeptide MFS transporter [bacterium]
MNPPHHHRLLEAAKVYLDKRILAILFLGFSSGLPLALVGGTLSIWLTEVGVSKTSIGLFAMVGIPYTLKFLWAPLVDRMPLPLFTRILGRRRGWMLFTQIILAAAIVGLGQTHPSINPSLTALLALTVAFCSASQDIVIDAFRVDILQRPSFGAGAATIVFGYRIGMLVSGAGALYLATFYPWSTVYYAMAALVGIGMITTLLSPEPNTVGDIAFESPGKMPLKLWLKTAIINPFSNFTERKYWLIIILFIVFYKLGDAFAGNMSNPFFIEIGFTKIEIANISKLFGFIATIVGGFIGGVMVSRFGLMRGLLICGIFQLLSNLVFSLQAYVGNDISMLMVTIATENITSGMGTAAFVAYLSGLCNASYSATQYALLSSFASVGRTFLASSAGLLAENVTWITYFILTTLIAVPGILILLWLIWKNPNLKEDLL